MDIKNLGRMASLIPAKYYLGAAGTAIVLLSYGIGKTVVTPVAVPKAVTSASRTPQSVLQIPQQSAVPPSVMAGNVFRRQRAEHQVPPPPPPLQPADPNEPVPDVKLLGIIITDTKRMAILDAEVKRYIRKEIGEQLVLSGMKQAPISDDGRYYEVISVKGDKLASQTFNEGDMVSDYRLSSVNEDFIEVASLASGKKTSIFLDSGDAAKSLSGRMSKVQAVMVPRPFNTSGAVTK